MADTKTVIIDALSVAESSQLCISQFSNNFDTVKFCIPDTLTGYTLMVVADIEGTPVIFETDGTRLYTEKNQTTGQTYLVWHPGREITCTDGIVVYQIAAYKTRNDEIVSTWYSAEGRIIVSDSIDTTAYSSALIGSHPDLVTRLILETDKLRQLADNLETGKVDKEEGKVLSQNDFTDLLKNKLSGIEEGAKVNTIEKIMVDGVGLDVNENDKSVNIELQERFDSKVDAEFGMGLSTNDFTDSDAMKLSDIEEGAQKNVQSDWNTSDTKSDAYIKNKPVIDQSYKSESQNAQSGTAVAQAIAQLVGSAPDKLNTLEELADALKDNADIVDVLNEAIGGKVDKADGYGLSQIDYGTNISGQSFVVLNTVNVDNEPVQIFLYPIAETNALLALKADKSNHSDGFEGGRGASAENGGGAVGEFAQSYGGGSIGNYTFAMGGGAIGFRAETGDGFAGGYYARTVTNDEGIAIDAIQLGTGQNTQPGTLQIYNYTLMNADGRIPAERMAVTPITEIPATLSPNQTYHFSEAPANIAFPSADVTDGDTIYLTFMTGDVAPTISINITNTTDIDIEIDANTGYEIYGKYFEHIGKWIVGYSEYSITDGESV